MKSADLESNLLVKKKKMANSDYSAVLQGTSGKNKTNQRCFLWSWVTPCLSMFPKKGPKPSGEFIFELNSKSVKITHLFTWHSFS